MNAKTPLALSKPCIDIGYFTRQPQKMLEFWRDEMGLVADAPVEFNNGLTQHRHALGKSVIKINTATQPLPTVPSRYTELLIADDSLAAPQHLTDPDGNRITRVPAGHQGIHGLGLKVTARDGEALVNFYTSAMGFEADKPNQVRCGDSVIQVESASTSTAAGHWVNLGLTYFTVHVMRVDEAFATMTEAGASVGERPYSIERIARISFVRDPNGNWIEVAQRASLAGGWWE